MFSLLYTFCLHFYLINIHISYHPDSRLSGLFTEVPTCPDNRGSTELNILNKLIYFIIVSNGTHFLIQNMDLFYTSFAGPLFLVSARTSFFFFFFCAIQNWDELFTHGCILYTG